MKPSTSKMDVIEQNKEMIETKSPSHAEFEPKFGAQSLMPS